MRLLKSVFQPIRYIGDIRWQGHRKTSGAAQTDDYTLNIGTRTWAWRMVTLLNFVSLL
jgi:hypothetical protein